MRSKPVSRISAIASVALSLVTLALPTPAQANGLLLFGAQGSQAAMFLLSSGSLCIDFTYDPNGNRTSQSSVTIGSGATLWGAKAFGCFVWGQ